jgi:hypothetical protein
MTPGGGTRRGHSVRGGGGQVAAQGLDNAVAGTQVFVVGKVRAAYPEPPCLREPCMSPGL